MNVGIGEGGFMLATLRISHQEWRAPGGWPALLSDAQSLGQAIKLGHHGMEYRSARPHRQPTPGQGLCPPTWTGHDFVVPPWATAQAVELAL